MWACTFLVVVFVHEKQKSLGKFWSCARQCIQWVNQISFKIIISSFSQLCTVILHFGDEKWTLKPYASSYCKQTGIKFLIKKEMFCRAQELASLSQTFLRFEYMYITMSPNLFSFRVLFFQHHFECFSW